MKNDERSMRGPARRMYTENAPQENKSRRVYGESEQKNNSRRVYGENARENDSRRVYGENAPQENKSRREPLPEKKTYRGNACAPTRYPRSPKGETGPRVGAVYANVPTARRVDGAPTQADAELEEKGVLPEEEGMLAGRNPIREALKAGRPVEKLLVAQGDLSGAAREIIRMAKDAGAVVQTVDRARLDAIYPAHQGMLAYVAAVEYKTVEDILDLAAARNEEPFIVILDGVTDPHNVGAIIRTAECAGAHGVILPERRSAGLGPAAAKAAAGALSYMPVARVKNLNRTIDELKEKGVWIIGTAMDGEDALKADLTGAAALVIGSEGDGISRLTLEKCDRRLTLPMKGSIESLNASVAAGILMYEIMRARRT